MPGASINVIITWAETKNLQRENEVDSPLQQNRAQSRPLHMLINIYSTDTFHVTVSLFSYWPHVMSKCGKNNKKVAPEAMQIVSLNKCSFHILTLKWSITKQTHGNMESISFVWKNSRMLLMETSFMRLPFIKSLVRSIESARLIQLIV